MATEGTLVAVGCASRVEAEHALEVVQGLDVELHDAAIVVRTPDGRLDLHQTKQVAAGEGVVAGGTIGLVAGMLLGGPVGGALVGMLGGGAWGARDTGIADSRLRELGNALDPGGAVLCVLVEPVAVAPVREQLGDYGEAVEVDVSLPR